MDVAPLRPQHFPSIVGEVVRTDRDVPAEDRRRRSATAAVAAALLRREPRAPSLVATADGAIGRMLLTIPAYAVREPSPATSNPYAVAYRDLLAKLPSTTELVVLTHEAVQTSVAEWLAGSGRTDTSTLVATDDFLGFSIWAEDGYVVVTDDGRPAFVEPAAFGRYGHALVADHVSEAADMGLFQAPLYLQGGNVLVGDDFFLIGLDYPILTFEKASFTRRPAESSSSCRRCTPATSTFIDGPAGRQHPARPERAAPPLRPGRSDLDRERVRRQCTGHSTTALPSRHVHHARRPRGGRPVPSPRR